MESYRRITDVKPLAASVLTLGTLDGLHRGHQAVIDRAVKLARTREVPAVVLTFDPHPQHILAPSGVPKKELIITLDKKLSLLEDAGVDLTLVVAFDQEFSLIKAEDFLKKIVVALFRPEVIVIGYDHHFGHRRQGDARFLREHASNYAYQVEEVEAVHSSSSTISSSSIRKLLKAGRCEEAELLLGRPYEISGKIIQGIRRGQVLSYPTANLTPGEPAQLIPMAGVYVVSAEIHQKTTFGMCNVGYRPTFNGDTLTVETHFFAPPVGNMYGLAMAIRFHHRIRDERRFDNAEELVAQLDRDKQTSLDWIYEHLGGENIHASVS